MEAQHPSSRPLTRSESFLPGKTVGGQSTGNPSTKPPPTPTPTPKPSETPQPISHRPQVFTRVGWNGRDYNKQLERELEGDRNWRRLDPKKKSLAAPVLQVSSSRPSSHPSSQINSLTSSRSHSRPTSGHNAPDQLFVPINVASRFRLGDNDPHFPSDSSLQHEGSGNLNMAYKPQHSSHSPTNSSSRLDPSLSPDQENVPNSGLNAIHGSNAISTHDRPFPMPPTIVAPPGEDANYLRQVSEQTYPVGERKDSELGDLPSSLSKRGIRLSSAGERKLSLEDEDLQISKILKIQDLVDDGVPEVLRTLPELYPPNQMIYDYRAICRKQGCVPVRFIEKSLKNSELVMNDHGLGVKGAKALALSLEKNGFIERLILRNNSINALGCVAMARMLSETSYIAEVDLSSNKIGSEGLRSMGEMLKETRCLKILRLEQNSFLDIDAAPFCLGLKENETLEVLGLAGNYFGDLAATKFAAVLATNRTLLELDLSWNRIREKGAKALAAGLSSNTTLKRLLLGRNGVADDGVLSLCDNLRSHPAMEVIDLSFNSFGAKGAMGIAGLIGAGGRLINMNVAGNTIGNDAIKAILRATKENKQMIDLGLGGMNLDAESRELASLLGSSTRPVKVLTRGASSYDVPRPDLIKKTKEIEQQYKLKKQASTLSDGAFDKVWSSVEKKYKEENAKKKVGFDENIDDEDENSGLLSRGSKKLRERDARMRKQFQTLYPGLKDPLEVIEDFLVENRLRLVDLFFQIDKNRDGSVTSDEMEHAVVTLGINLNEIQFDELMSRLDSDGNGTIEYNELCEGKRRFTESNMLRNRQMMQADAEADDEPPTPSSITDVLSHRKSKW